MKMREIECDMDKIKLSNKLFFLSALIAVYIIIAHKAPWPLIALYWVMVAYKYGVDMDDHK